MQNWGDDFTIQGTDNFYHVPGVLSTNYVTVWEYDETVAGDVSLGWKSATSASDILYPGKGFAVIANAGATLDVKGTVNHNTSYTSAFNVTNSGGSGAGFNILANPYPSPIRWSGAGVNNLRNYPGQVALAGSMHMWVTTGQYSGTYQSHNGSVASGPSITNVIPAQQAFFVQKITAGNAPLIANNSIREDASNPIFFEEAVLPNSLNIQLGFDSLMDACNLTFYSGATDSFDNDFDAAKFLNYGAANALVYTNDGYNNKYGINFLPDFATATNYVVPVNIEPKGQGNYTFTFDGVNTFAAPATVLLEDMATNTWQNLATNKSYTVNMGNTNCNNRFYLHFAPNGITDVATIQTAEASNSSIYTANGKLFIANYGASAASENAKLVIYNSLGQEVSNTQISITKGLQQMELPQLNNGSYIVKLQAATKTLTNKLVVR